MNDFSQFMQVSVTDLEFSARLENELTKMGIITVKDLYGLDSEVSLRKFKQRRGIGAGTLNELINWFRHYPDPRYNDDGSAVEPKLIDVLRNRREKYIKHMVQYANDAKKCRWFAAKIEAYDEMIEEIVRRTEGKEGVLK